MKENTRIDMDNESLIKKRNTVWKRLMPRLEARFAQQVKEDEWQGFVHRLQKHFDRLFRCLYRLYGREYDFFYHLENILVSAAELWIARPDDLKAMDAMRETDPYWYQSNRMVGAMCYVDLFAGTLQGLIKHIPYPSGTDTGLWHGA